MMNYVKKFLFISSVVAIFFVCTPSAFASLVCTGTTASTANITETSSSGYCIGSSFLYRGGSMIGAIGCGTTFYDAGLSPSTSYSYTSSYGSTVCVTKAKTGTVRVTPNIASATWTLTGPMTSQSGTGSVNLINKNTGSYNIVWNNVAGYTKLLTVQTLTLPASGGAITFSNTYTLIPAFTYPVVSSPTVSSITSSSAILGANITSDGGAPITARGTCWGLTSTTATTCMAEGGIALGVFSHLRTGLPAGTTIYYRGYATNSAGLTGYSSPVTSFSTLAGATIPTLTTLPATSITSSSALLGFSFSNTGGAPITAKGLCWGTAPSPTTNCNDYGPGSGAPGEWGGVITGMPSGTLIYFRAYGTNSAGMGWSVPSMSFTTLSAPTIDLTASAVIPTTAVALAPTSFSATISNTGTSGTGASFTSLFQFDDADHSVVFASQNSPTSAISAGGTTNISTSYTFPSTGTWYVRACADLNTAFVGTIAELPAINENNNCGAIWTPVTVSATTGTLTTPNCTISTGLSSCNSTVSWSITNPVAPNWVRQNGTNFSTASSGSTSRTLPYGAHTFTLYSNAITLATNIATASCILGTSWNGSVCAIPPAFSCTGATPAGATIYTGDDMGLSSNTTKTYNAVNTAPKCQFSCNTGSSWNGASCVATACGDNICNGTETLLTCPKDCKAKVRQF